VRCRHGQPEKKTTGKAKQKQKKEDRTEVNSQKGIGQEKRQVKKYKRQKKTQVGSRNEQCHTSDARGVHSEKPTRDRKRGQVDIPRFTTKRTNT